MNDRDWFLRGVLAGGLFCLMTSAGTSRFLGVPGSQSGPYLANGFISGLVLTLFVAAIALGWRLGTVEASPLQQLLG
jgi:hypothetical protein